MSTEQHGEHVAMTLADALAHMLMPRKASHDPMHLLRFAEDLTQKLDREFDKGRNLELGLGCSSGIVPLRRTASAAAACSSPLECSPAAWRSAASADAERNARHDYGGEESSRAARSCVRPGQGAVAAAAQRRRGGARARARVPSSTRTDAPSGRTPGPKPQLSNHEIDPPPRPVLGRPQ
eukprot:6179624-Pleurochrysis_carterae.AAC.1